jgi:hypothetical protein
LTVSPLILGVNLNVKPLVSRSNLPYPEATPADRLTHTLLENDMKRLFRKYHRALAIIIFLPLGLTIITGTLVTLTREWHLNLGIPASLLLSIHTGEIFHLEGIYPLLDGIGALGLLVTGLSMTSLFNKKPVKANKNSNQA